MAAVLKKVLKKFALCVLCSLGNRKPIKCVLEPKVRRRWQILILSKSTQAVVTTLGCLLHRRLEDPMNISGSY